ncbi:hypothetical protein [Chryseobacterium taklimakanense]|uniref:hypothetical protein n=1 Tax=Chryseobacterium taklimakanense TaxID=536441 RepID=UPI0023F70A2B|nr:hypothetical protein [Chryseobacterium taklimakanense]
MREQTENNLISGHFWGGTARQKRARYFVEPQIQNSNSFLEDLRKINQLMDSPYQSDISEEKVYHSKPINSKTFTR